MCCMIEFDNHLLFNTFDVKTILIGAKWLLSIVKRKTGPMTCSLVKRVLSNVSSFTWKERCLTRWALSSCLPLKCYHLWILPDFPSGSGSKKKKTACNVGDLHWIPELGRSPWRRKWQPTPVFLPGEPQGQRSLMGYSPWGCKESDMTEQLSTVDTSVLLSDQIFSIPNRRFKK